MKHIYHKAESRGHADHGWLESYLSFSFAEYHDPDRIQFGALRVLNDDRVQGGMGFGQHPHSNMEIVSIPLEGALEHRDNMNNSFVIGTDEIQVMSAGSGVMHSEFNHNESEVVNFLQIWIIPNKYNVKPRYDQKSYDLDASPNNFINILNPDQSGETVWIHQDAWFYIGKFMEDRTVNHSINAKGNGLYAFVIEGWATISGNNIGRRDGLGLWEADDFEIECKAGSRILLMEVPMVLK